MLPFWEMIIGGSLMFGLPLITVMYNPPPGAYTPYYPPLWLVIMGLLLPVYGAACIVLAFIGTRKWHRTVGQLSRIFSLLYLVSLAIIAIISVASNFLNFIGTILVASIGPILVYVGGERFMKGELVKEL